MKFNYLIYIIILCTHINSQGKRKKRLFWLPAIAPLLSVILSTLIVFLTRADEHGIKIVKHIKGGLNPSSVHQLQLNGPYVGEVAKVGLIVAVVALTVGDHLFNTRTYKTNTLIKLPNSSVKISSTSGSDRCRPIFCIDKRIPPWWKQRNGCHGLHEHHRFFHFLLCCNWWASFCYCFVMSLTFFLFFNAS